MNAPAKAARNGQKPKKKLPYLTDDDLASPVQAVKIKIFGEYFKRGEHRNDVYEEPYEAEIVVPKAFNMGHVKLQANRHVKRHLNGVRVRTFNVDTDFVAEPVKDKEYTVKDFISDMGLQDNQRQKEMYLQQVEHRRAQAEREADPDYVPPFNQFEVKHRLVNDHNYGVGSNE